MVILESGLSPKLRVQDSSDRAINGTNDHQNGSFAIVPHGFYALI